MEQYTLVSIQSLLNVIDVELNGDVGLHLKRRNFKCTAYFHATACGLKCFERSLKSYSSWTNFLTLRSVFIRDNRTEDQVPICALCEPLITLSINTMQIGFR